MEKEKWKKKAKIIISILIFLYTYTRPPSRCIQNLKKLAQMGAEKSATEFFAREKEKWTNKGTDKKYVADF